MAGVPADHLVVDLDCRGLRLPVERKRCDFLFVGEDEDSAWVVPIELKSGNFSPKSVALQLQGGACLAAKWLPDGAEFVFVPVVAHGQGIRKEKLKALRRTSVTLRGRNANQRLSVAVRPFAKCWWHRDP